MLVCGLRACRLCIHNPIHSFKYSSNMKGKITQRIKLIKFGIGIVAGVAIYLLISLI